MVGKCKSLDNFKVVRLKEAGNIFSRCSFTCFMLRKDDLKCTKFLEGLFVQYPPQWKIQVKEFGKK